MTSNIPEVQRAAEPLLQQHLPDKAYVTLNEIIECLAKHYVQIPEDVANKIENFVRTWLNDPELHPAARLLPPTGLLTSLYRRSNAANVLHWELMEHGENGPAWRNWLNTGQAVRLDADGRKRATSILESIVHSTKQKFDAILSGDQQLRPSMSVRYSPTDIDEDRQWLDCLGFETKEIFGFLGDGGQAGSEPENASESEPEWIPTNMIATLFGAWSAMPQRQRVNWPETFANPAPALKASARKSQGQGKEALWNPVAVATWLREKRRWPVPALDRIFTSDSLKHWQPIWKPESERLGHKLGQ